MIPASRSHYANYENTDGQPTMARPVIAWDDDGHPMVVGTRGLVRAEECGNFRRITEEEAPIVAAIPGGGWLIDCTDDEGYTWTDPILAWTIHADGSLTPRGTDSDGVTDDATRGLSSYRIRHPDAKTPTKVVDGYLRRPGSFDPTCPDCCGSGWPTDGNQDPSERCGCRDRKEPQTTA